MFMQCFLEIKFADIRLILLEHVTNVFVSENSKLDKILLWRMSFHFEIEVTNSERKTKHNFPKFTGSPIVFRLYRADTNPS